MDVGVQMEFASHGSTHTTDAEVWDEELLPIVHARRSR